jgi:CheY-like chemotaxis protein
MMEPLLSEPDGVRVLHVDEDPHFLNLTRTFLERQDESLTVLTETDPDDVIERLRTERIDCVVSGYELRGTDGLVLLEEIQEFDAELPVLLFTDQGSEEIAVDAIELGVDSYVRQEEGTSKYVVLGQRILSAVERRRDRRRAEKAREVYELLAKVSTDAFWIRDIETRETLYSDGIRQFGYEPGIREDGFQWWLNRVHPDDRQASLDVNEAQEAGDPAGFTTLNDEYGEFTHRYRWRCADDSYIDCLSRGVVRFEDGEGVEMIGAMTNLSDWDPSPETP